MKKSWLTYLFILGVIFLYSCGGGGSGGFTASNGLTIQISPPESLRDFPPQTSYFIIEIDDGHCLVQGPARMLTVVP